MTFDELFSSEKNKTLSGYLTQIYRFLGLYVVGIGTMLLAFSSEKILKISYVRIRIFYALGSLLIVNFIYLMWAALVLFTLSLYAHIKIGSYENK